MTLRPNKCQRKVLKVFINFETIYYSKIYDQCPSIDSIINVKTLGAWDDPSCVGDTSICYHYTTSSLLSAGVSGQGIFSLPEEVSRSIVHWSQSEASILVTLSLTDQSQEVARLLGERGARGSPV